MLFCGVVVVWVVFVCLDWLCVYLFYIIAGLIVCWVGWLVIGLNWLFVCVFVCYFVCCVCCNDLYLSYLLLLGCGVLIYYYRLVWAVICLLYGWLMCFGYFVAVWSWYKTRIWLWFTYWLMFDVVGIVVLLGCGWLFDVAGFVLFVYVLFLYCCFGLLVCDGCCLLISLGWTLWFSLCLVCFRLYWLFCCLGLLFVFIDVLMVFVDSSCLVDSLLVCVLTCIFCGFINSVVLCG